MSSAAGNDAATRLLLVSGLSGAGKSTGLKALEDLGYEAIDNLPLPLLGDFLNLGMSDGRGRAIAIGIDCRTRAFSVEEMQREMTRLRGLGGLDVELLFFDCDDREIRRRYTETRRRHPMAGDRPLADGIAEERAVLAPLRDLAEQRIDSTNLSANDLRRFIAGHYNLEGEPGLTVGVISFAYPRGLPRQADLVFDVRFLANPHYVDGLRAGSGQDPEVGDFIAADPAFAPFFESLSGLLLSLLPLYAGEGKSYLTIALGCTGGRHRSVFLAEKMAALLQQQGFRVSVRHRDLDTLE